MKKLFLTVLSIATLAASTAEARSGGYVHGYTRANGTYVNGYYRGGSGGDYTSTSPSLILQEYPPTFVGKVCGNAHIAVNRTCRAGTPLAKHSHFENCTEAWDSGVQDIPVGDPAYADKLDRDHDGIACEISDMYNGTTWMYDLEAASLRYVPVTPKPTQARMNPKTQPGNTRPGVIQYVNMDAYAAKYGVKVVNFQGDLTLSRGGIVLHLADYPDTPTVNGKKVPMPGAVNINGDIAIPVYPVSKALAVNFKPGDMPLLVEQ